MMQIDDVELVPSTDYETKACLRLWGAAFIGGINDTVAHWKEGREYHWFDDDRDYPGSFVWLCDLFNIGVEQARSSVRMKARQLERAFRRSGGA